MTTRHVVAVLACHGRRAVTLQGLRALFDQQLPAGVTIGAVLVDDASPDGTADAVTAAFPAVRVLHGDGNLWWAGAMALGLAEAACMPVEFHLWLNDDVRLDDDALATLLAAHDAVRTETGTPPIVVGPTREPASEAVSYGGQRRTGRHPLKLVPVPPNGFIQTCHTFQGNVVLVPASVTRRLGGIGAEFSGVQGMADTDFGLRATAAGIPVRLATRTVGDCARNRNVPAWRDPSVGIWGRLAALWGPRGFPPPPFLALMRRHGGAFWWLWGASVWCHALADALTPPKPALKPRRLALLAGVVPHYRVPQLAGLATIPNWQITVYLGRGQPGGWSATSVPADQITLPTVITRNWFWPWGKGRRAWTGGSLAALTSDADAIMAGFHVHDLSVWLVWLVRQLSGRPRLLLSGHFQLDPEEGDADTLSSRLRRAMRIALARGADAVLPYTPRGADACRRNGIPESRIHVTHNSLDTTAIRATAGVPDPDEAAMVRARYGLPNGPLFLSIGRLYPAKRFDLAVAAVGELHAKGYDCGLLVVGDGPDRARLQAAAGADGPVRFAGQLFEEATLAPLFRQATALVLPDSVGLAVVHAFAHGVPVVTCPGRAHGPEVDYLEPQRNGLMASTAEPPALARCMARLLDDPTLRARLADGARSTADALSVADGVTAIRTALSSVIGSGRG